MKCAHPRCKNKFKPVKSFNEKKYCGRKCKENHRKIRNTNRTEKYRKAVREYWRKTRKIRNARKKLKRDHPELFLDMRFKKNAYRGYIRRV